MKFSLSWLKTHLETDAPLDTITDTLTRIGLELEGVEDAGAALAAFRVAHVTAAVQHPNADRLRVCTVDAGGEPVTVVCGAPNARAGMKTVFAAPGSHIPGLNTVLKVGEIRGVQSAGMLLSYREMGLGEDHDGIADLPDDAPVGMPYPAYAGLDDPVIDISITPNRGDALAVRGVARDLAAAGIGTLRPWSPAPVTGRFPSPVVWAIESPACHWVQGRTIRGVRNASSPEWLQRRLRSIGLRPISALVDITNFFTVDLGRPLHVFDADRIQGGVLTFRPGRGEAFRALNGRDYTATEEDCVIADAAGVQSLAGVMGGEATGSQAETTSVFIECALFDPVSVALTGRRHDIISDARSRFERGIDPSLIPAALDAATAMVIELCGGEPSELAEAGSEPAWQRDATLRFHRLETLGGLAVPAADAVRSLEGLGFTVRTQDADQVTVAVPPWRNDVAGSGGLDQAPALLPELALSRRLGPGGCGAGGRYGRGGAASEGPGCGATGLDARHGARSARDLYAAANPRRDRPSHLGKPRDAGMRHLLLHRPGPGRAVRRRAGGHAAGEPDRRGSGPDAAHPVGHARSCRRPQRGAGPAVRGAVRGRARPSRRRRRRCWPPGCAMARRHEVGCRPSQGADTMGVKADVLALLAALGVPDGKPQRHCRCARPLPSRAGRGRCGRGLSSYLPISVSCTRSVLGALELPAPGGRIRNPAGCGRGAEAAA